MKLIIETRFEDSDGQAGPTVVVSEIERQDGNLTDLGLTLAEGRDLLGQVQSRLVSQQAQSWLVAPEQSPEAACTLVFWGDCGWPELPV